MAEDRRFKDSQDIIDGKKRCSVCHQIKPLSSFWADKILRSGYCSQCKNCKGSRHKKWRDSLRGNASREKAYREQTWRNEGFKLTVAEYDSKYIKQKGRCAICGKHQSEMKNKLSVDHNHATGRVRGLLCGGCNLYIGILETNSNKFQKAQKYLKHWES